MKFNNSKHFVSQFLIFPIPISKDQKKKRRIKWTSSKGKQSGKEQQQSELAKKPWYITENKSTTDSDSLTWKTGIYPYVQSLQILNNEMHLPSQSRNYLYFILCFACKVSQVMPPHLWFSLDGNKVCSKFHKDILWAFLQNKRTMHRIKQFLHL